MAVAVFLVVELSVAWWGGGLAIDVVEERGEGVAVEACYPRCGLVGTGGSLCVAQALQNTAPHAPVPPMP